MRHFRRAAQCVLAALVILGPFAACDGAEIGMPAEGLADGGIPSVATEPPSDAGAADGAASKGPAVDGGPAESGLPPVTQQLSYGTSVKGQDLPYFSVTPPQPSGKKALLVFAVHGFEDAWAQDGRALERIAFEIIARFGAQPALLSGWTLYVVPSANPDGMRLGSNNDREGTPGADGRCTSEGNDINRGFGTGTFKEQVALRKLADALDPTVLIDFHGWYNTYYGDAVVGHHFADAFNASYAGKPARYCFVSASGVETCTEPNGGTFHASATITAGLMVDWARKRGIQAALVEYPGPDFDLDGTFDTVADGGGLREAPHALLRDRTFVALDSLFAAE